uniref:Flavoprotein domain-containing protein n=1 Tax=Gongylonema pulchrum TaxID=637853 RepID=A0A183DSS0_9BILA
LFANPLKTHLGGPGLYVEEELGTLSGVYLPAEYPQVGITYAEEAVGQEGFIKVESNELGRRMPMPDGQDSKQQLQHCVVLKKPRVEDDPNAGYIDVDVTTVDHFRHPPKTREPYGPDHVIAREGGKFHLLIGITGSVASIKLSELITELQKQSPQGRLVIRVVATEAARAFIDESAFEIPIYNDLDEWNMWKKRGDPVLHIGKLPIFELIELRRWADAMVVAPLDANTLAKWANGLCDNLLTSIVRCWDPRKPMYYAPAMNVAMWENPLTYQHRKTLKDLFRYKEIPPIEKELMCGDTGLGAMATVQMVASILASEVKNRFAVYSDHSKLTT